MSNFNSSPNSPAPTIAHQTLGHFPGVTPGTKKFLGQTIDGRYKVVGAAEGGMAYVLFCQDKGSGQMVALKMQKEGAGSTDLFLNEAKTWISLGVHPHIVQALYASRVGSTAYIVLEMIPPTTSGGCSLRNWLEERFPFDPELALRWIVQICDAMEYAVKTARLVHRDIKPENILITPRYEARLTDFGLAASQMGAGLQGGTPRYMAPEQRFGSSDTRSDIYALGLVMVELFLGSGWELDEMDEETIKREFNRQVRPTPPWLTALAAIAARCLQPDPRQRYESFANLKHALDELTCRYLDMPAVRMLSRPVSSSVQLTNQGLACLNLGLHDEGIRLLQRAAARPTGDGIAISRLRYELQKEGFNHRIILNQLKENCATAGWWLRILLLAGFFVACFAFSPATLYDKICAGLISALLIVETTINEYTLLTLNLSHRIMLWLCVFLYGLSWVLLPTTELPPFGEQVRGWLIGSIPLFFYLIANWIWKRYRGQEGLSSGIVKLLAPILIVLGYWNLIFNVVFTIANGFMGPVFVIIQRMKFKRQQRQGIYMAAELSSFFDLPLAPTFYILLAVNFTFLFLIHR